MSKSSPLVGVERAAALDLSSAAAVVFDVDGVLLESVRCKGVAFRRLLAEWPDHLDAIERLHLAHGGMSRYEKLERIFRDVLHEPLSIGRRDELALQFGRYVEEELRECPLVDGVPEMLAYLHGRRPMYVASATPQDELRGILDRRELTRYFRDIFGYPTTKASALQLVCDRERVPAAQLVFIGDAAADRSAAAAVGCRFIGRLLPDGSNTFPDGTPAVRSCVELLRLAQAFPS